MTTGRETGQYEPDCLVDDRHPIIDIDDAYSSPDDWVDLYIDRLRNIDKDYHTDDYYKFPRWYGQKNYVEIWTEKEAAVKRLIDISNKNNLQVRIVPFGGFPSFAGLDDHVKRLKTKMDLGKNIIILYLGDFDPSGVKIDETTKNRLLFIWHVNSYSKQHNVKFVFQRIAVTKKQIIDYDLPWDPEKTGEEEQEKLFNNPNYKSMQLRHGQVYACGLDAFEILRPKEYENTIVEWVNRLFDNKKYRTELEKHEEDYQEEYITDIRLDRIQKFLEELKEE